ncbi:MAG TPA: tetratricopeptide repeat protein [Clostridia bacterium]|jgi:Flp pilus assembly protein TadD|nr:tetratricopeptide repeat protein [Clostridia bacterium]HRU83756.1 tetratricopeptide repeat protein [Eubacteriales bacterium]
MIYTYLTIAIFAFLTIMSGIIALFAFGNLYSADLYLIRGKRAFKAGDYQRALDCFSEALKLKRFKLSSPQICYENMAMAALNLGDKKNAALYAEKAEESGGDSAGLFLVHATALYEDGEVRRAYEILTPAAEKYPADFNVASLLALAAAELGFFGLAEESLQRAVENGYPEGEKLKALIEELKPKSENKTRDNNEE